MKIMSSAKNKKISLISLDIRGILIICAALFLVTNSALCDNVKEDEIKKFVIEINDISRALESYSLDTGQVLRNDNDWPENLSDIRDLIRKPVNVDGWNGPYLTKDYQGSSECAWLEHRKYGLISIYRQAKDFSIGEGSVLGEGDCSVNEGLCQYYISFSNIPLSLQKRLDVYYDKASSPNSGIVRYYHSKSSGMKNQVFIVTPIVAKEQSLDSQYLLMVK